ncbi:DNA-processing protein DprA [Aliidiomarina sp. Khilg15.8]
MWTRQSIEDWLALLLAPQQLHQLLQKHHKQGTIGNNLAKPLAGLTRFWRQQLPRVESGLIAATLDWLEHSEQHFILTRTCQDYPEALAEIDRPPWLLFGCGDRSLLSQPQLAMVGSRRASPYGLEQATQISRELAQYGWCVCSGMALGIDSASHRGALAIGGKTVAVLGGGPDVCYPPRARELYAEIAQKGLLLSEFIPQTQVRSDHFLRRNRIISGISQGVVVVEAGLRSGSLVTARLALEQNRNVYAVPGPVTQAGYRGSHRLIQQGANLVTCSSDILQDLPSLQRLSPEVEVSVSRAMAVPPGLANQQMLVNVGFETTSIDSLVERTRLPVAMVMNQLISLELDGWVAAVPGGYVRVRRE